MRWLGVGLLALVSACGKPDAEAQPVDRQEVSKRDPTGAISTTGPRPAWQRRATPMPATFAGFPRPDLAAMDGAWIVDPSKPEDAIVWLIEAEASKLTTVDALGHESIYGLTLSSPCALRLTDSGGRASTRAIAQTDDALIITTKGAVAVSSREGALLACVGARTYQIAADGQCRFTTEMLGVWSEPAESAEVCKLDVIAGEPVLLIAGLTLRSRDGVWMDEIAAASVLEPSASRAAAVARITPVVEVVEVGTETDGTGETSSPAE